MMGAYVVGYKAGWIAAEDGLDQRGLHPAADRAAYSYSGRGSIFNYEYYDGFVDGWNDYILEGES